MEKIVVIGSPGAGKSREEFEICVKEIVKKDKWIIDGNYQRTLEIRLRECDTIFLMDYPLDVCLLGAESRIGKKREDMPWIESKFNEEFKQWIIDFSKDKLPYIYELLEKYQKNREIVIFKSRKEADDYLLR